MATTKVCGVETEYGILSPGPEQNPIAASSVLVNAYAADVEQQIGWDFEDETPGNDARGFAREGSLAPMVETHLANTVLTNGARFYVDHAHPEYSSPECLTPLECLVFDKAGEEVLRRAMVAAALRMPDQPAPIVYKNNSDGKGNSYGCHENYMMDRAVPFAKVIDGVVPHFVSRTLFTGSGKVGVETPALDAETVEYQLSQRAEFFEEIVGLETTLKRPIVNTRDEPHADPKRFRRLHVIVGDANLSEIATFLKVGTTAIVLAMVEDDAGPTRAISRCPTPCAHCTRCPPTCRSRAPSPSPTARPQPRSNCSGSSSDRRASTPKNTVSRHWVTTGRWVRSCWSTGRPSSRASRRTPPPWPTRWTGWPSASSCWPIRTATPAGGGIHAWRHWHCSTTTSDPTGRCSRASVCAPWSTPQPSPSR